MTVTISNKDFVGILPEEISSHVFSFCDESSISASQRVCKVWKSLTEILKFMRPIKLIQKFTNSSIVENQMQQAFSVKDPINPFRGWNDFFKKYTVTSVQELVNSFATFCTTLKDGETGLFKCFFSLNPLYNFEIKCGRNMKYRTNVTSDSDRKEFCFFGKLANTNTEIKKNLAAYETRLFSRPFSYICLSTSLPEQLFLKFTSDLNCVDNNLCMLFWNLSQKVFKPSET